MNQPSCLASFELLTQALNEYANTLPPVARAGFVQLTQQHINVITPVLKEAVQRRDADPAEQVVAQDHD